VAAKTKFGDSVRFCVLCVVLIWVIHAIVFFAHEYAHSGTAWMLGYKENPWALEYGRFNLSNLVLFGEVDENVDYQSIFAQGRGLAAAWIAFAGMGMNALLYGFSRMLLRRQSVRNNPFFLLCIFWFCFMNVGNFYDYVPVRTFASHGDIANMRRGLNVSPWLILVVLGYPTALAIWHFFARILREALPRITHGVKPQQVFTVLTSAFLMFGYFGASGLSGYGEVSQVLSGISALAAPAVALLCSPLVSDTRIESSRRD